MKAENKEWLVLSFSSSDMPTTFLHFLFLHEKWEEKGEKITKYQ